MLNILLPVDGSDASNKALASFIDLSRSLYKEMPIIHLLNVQLPLHGDVSMFINKENTKQFHQEEGMKKLQSACELLDQAAVIYQHHIVVGDPAEMIN